MTDRKKPGRHWPGFFFVAMACATFAAQAQQVDATGDYLSRMDADRDGRVSLVEYQDWLSYAFDGMDKNRDGTLSPEEQPGGRGRPITRTEHRDRLADRFKRQDANHDDYLTARELAAPPQ